jgi:hypothetical protein
MGKHTLYYFRAVLYWFKVLTAPPIFDEDGVPSSTTEMKEVVFSKANHRDAVLAFLSSNLYSLYYTMWSSCQVVNSSDFDCPVNIDKLVSEVGADLSTLAKSLMDDYQRNSVIQQREYRSRGREFVMRKQYFFIKNSKPIIDEIDRVLAQHYGFTDEELDFIINYDIKYRMGRDSGDES